MADTKRVIVTGATGLIGKQLCFQLAAKGYEVVVCSRNPESARRVVPEAAEHVAWAAAEDGPWASAIDGAYAVINLAGANLFGKRWNEAYKREIRDSRVIGTRGLVNAMAKAQHKPAVFISGSAVGYYGFRDDTKLDESAAPGDDFLARMCVQWEQEATRAEELGIRTVLIRSGIVLSKPDGALPINLRGASWSRPGIVLDTRHGALPLMALPFRFFVGGPINATAPEPQTNREFSKTLGKVIGRPAWLPVPGFALKLMLGELAGMVTQGQRVVPQQAQKLGYPFKYPTSDEALRDLLK
jgi:NAD dependent epimerase/dehydratase family enzyme